MLKKAIDYLGDMIGSSTDSAETLALSTDTYRISFNNNHGMFKLRIENNRNNRKSLLHNEAKSLKLLASYKLAVQHPNLLAFVDDIFEKTFTLQSYIPGNSIVDVKHTTERYDYYMRIGEYLKHVHSIANLECGRLVSLQKTTWSDNFMNHFNADLEQANSFLSPILMEAIHSEVSSRQGSLTSNPRLLHGDTHPGNMIVNKDTISMIDFQHCLFGDPMFEVAQFYVRMLRHDNSPDVAMMALIKGLGYENIDLEIVRVYILALFINEIAFSSRINNNDRINFYVQELHSFLERGI